MAQAYLKDRSLPRIIAGHPWVYQADILRIEKPPIDGSPMVVRTAHGHYVGTGFYNSKSRIPIRILSRTKDTLDNAFFKNRLLAAIRYRQLHPPSGASRVSRLIWSEADFLPGLIADQYGDAIVLQTLTLGMDQRKEALVEVFREVHQPRLILERNDSPSRQYEGLPSSKGILFGGGTGMVQAHLGNILSELNLLEGQKTGSYLDQIQNQQIVASHAKGRRVLDCFTYHGGFALHAALAEAKEVLALDISAEAIETCKQNANLNKISNIQWKEANVFDELHLLGRAKRRFDLIILDPPSFTKTRDKVPEALRGYKEIHLRALQLLEPGGLLATFCCSHHVDTETFRNVILDAGFDSRKILRLIQSFTQSPDHPIIPAIPETEYLKGFLFEVT